MMKVGFILNPIAGMGGKVALKGTDGMEEEARKRGATPVSPVRAEEFLRALKVERDFYTCSGIMGEEIFKKVGKKRHVIYHAPSVTTAEDTKKSAEIMKEIVDIIVFAGGDGTAADIFDVVDTKMPILGIPAGVKMYSAVFALTPRDAAEILDSVEELEMGEREIMDIDEEAFRKGELRVKLKGYALSPLHIKLQGGKDVSSGGKEGIVEWFMERMDEKTMYIIGGGSTTWEIKRAIGIEGSFLGIDVVKGKRLICRDASEKEILKFLEKNAKIVVSPLGGQGFIFGRGNQPISSEVIKKVGKKNIVVVGTKEKMAKLSSLKVDTGDEKINDMLRGYIPVITGYGERKMMRVE